MSCDGFDDEQLSISDMVSDDGTSLATVRSDAETSGRKSKYW